MKKKLALAFMASAVVLLAPAQNTGSKPQNPGVNSLPGQTLFEKSMKEGVSCSYDEVPNLPQTIQRAARRTARPCNGDLT